MHRRRARPQPLPPARLRAGICWRPRWRESTRSTIASTLWSFVAMGKLAHERMKLTPRFVVAADLSRSMEFR